MRTSASFILTFLVIFQGGVYPKGVYGFNLFDPGTLGPKPFLKAILPVPDKKKNPAATRQYGSIQLLSRNPKQQNGLPLQLHKLQRC
jgi:hypothetical protein